ncbi:uncharacterized protein LOC113863654 [Abrus precatorius]|uniref:Uncharacterized protein LOC113863654 n=1 Tax=Abrus precatorius TaxID=3816 RepID=A0A8B8LCT7_ABRPR|nr:uncharacterized protein LOC113863654 [Abrus precatorius]
MWSCQVVIPKHTAPFNNTLVPSVSAIHLPRRRRHGVSTIAKEHIGELGHSLVATLQSDPNPIPKAREQGEIRGSDVLWALQRASVRKKKNKNKKESSSVATPMEQTAVDYANVRPLCINANWADKLDEFEKRLRELSDTV